YAMARTASDLDSLAAENSNIVPLVADVLSDSALSQIEALGSLDILMNNAGTNQPEPMVDVLDETLDRVMDLNVRSVFRVTRTVLAQMNDGGSIIHMSSQMAHVGSPNRTVYCMTKAALEGLTRAMAVELGPRGIRTNTLCPTFVMTPLTEGFFKNPEFAAMVERMIPLPGLPSPEDIAAAAVYLACDESRYVTGSALKIDGGWTAA
ncbi:MAG: SDR family NAD(P)-dependent oxidoreductase, partial [Litorivicinus sp.]